MSVPLRDLLPYPLFKEFTVLDRNFLEALCEAREQDLKALLQTLKPESFPGTISELNSDQHKFLLLRKYVSAHPEKSVESAIADLKNRCKYFCTKGKSVAEYARMSLTQDICESFLGFCRHGQIAKDEAKNAPILINRDLDQDFDHISLLASVVPVKSIFTLYITSIVNDVIKRVTMSQGTGESEKLSLSVTLLTSPTAYHTVLEELLNKHFQFTMDAKSAFHSVQPLVESEFASFVSRLILRADWGGGEKWRGQKMAVLRKMQFLTEEDVEGDIDRVGANVARDLEQLKDTEMWKFLLRGGIERFIHPEVSGDLITTFALLLMQRRVEDRGIIVILVPFPDALVLDILLSRVLSSKKDIYKKFTHSLKRTCILAYLPYPLNLDVLHELPFYFSPYSGVYYSEKYSERPQLQSSELLDADRNYIFKVTKSAAEMLGLKEAAQWNKYDTMLEGVTTLFRIVENEMAEHLKYIF